MNNIFLFIVKQQNPHVLTWYNLQRNGFGLHHHQTVTFHLHLNHIPEVFLGSGLFVWPVQDSKTRPSDTGSDLSGEAEWAVSVVWMDLCLRICALNRPKTLFKGTKLYWMMNPRLRSGSGVDCFFMFGWISVRVWGSTEERRRARLGFLPLGYDRCELKKSLHLLLIP